MKWLQKQGFGVKTWSAGMRVEALDRKTPTLICVATVGMQMSTVDWLSFCEILDCVGLM